MILPRREFLRMMGVAAGAASLGGCGREWLIPDRRVAEALRGPGLESHVQTICGLCEGGCGVTVRLVDGLPVGVKGNPNHPLNRGGLCPVGQAGLEVLYSPARLQGPMRRGDDGELSPTGWEEALEEIGSRLRSLRDEDRGGRIAILTGEPDLLFHELAERFLGTLGSTSISRLGKPAGLAFELTQGLKEPVGFDLSNVDLVLSFGLDLFEEGPAPLHTISAMVGSRPTGRRADHFHVGTRLSPSAAKAEQFVAVRPGTHGAFALGLAHVLVREGNYDRDFVEERTSGFEDWIDEAGEPRLGFRRLLLERYYPDRAAQLCGCEPARIVEVARRFASASRPLAVAGGEATRGSNATWTAMAVHALNALVGAFGGEGGIVVPPPIPLSPLPPPQDPLPVGEESLFTARRPDTAFAVDPIERLAERVLDDGEPLEVLLVISADPVHSSPVGERLLEVMKRVPTVVSMTPFADETASAADFILPLHVYLEGWQVGTTPAAVAFSTLGLGQPVIEPLFDTRHPGDVLLELGHRAGGATAAAVPWSDYSEYLKARLEGLVISGEGSLVTGTFEESWAHFLEERGWRFLEHRSLDDFWTDLVREAGWWNPVMARGDWSNLFRTSSGRFEFSSGFLEERLRELGRESSSEELEDRQALERGIGVLGLAAEPDEACLPHFEPPQFEGDGELALIPFRPITARGRLGPTSPMLLEMYGYPLLSEWETWIELTPEAAHHLDLGDGDRVAVESSRGAFEAVVRIQPGVDMGAVHVPLGLGHTDGFGAGAWIGANPIEAILPVRDSLAGTLALASTRVRLRLLRRRPHGGPAPLHGGHGA